MSYELPTKTEYEISLGKANCFITKEWSEPKYKCDICGGNMRRNEQMMCACNPPKYIYECDKCGHQDYLYS